MSDITPDVREKILRLQSRCSTPNCGSTYALHIHHRIFRSQGERGLHLFLEKALRVYLKTRAVELEPWSIHDIQNLVVICNKCHEGNIVGIHGGNIQLQKYFEYSFTDPTTGFNIPYAKNSLWQTTLSQ